MHCRHGCTVGVGTGELLTRARCRSQVIYSVLTLAVIAGAVACLAYSAKVRSYVCYRRECQGTPFLRLLCTLHLWLLCILQSKFERCVGREGIVLQAALRCRQNPCRRGAACKK